MPQQINRIVQGDCVAALRRMPEGSVNLAFADPPFNIGYEYDRYHDSRPPEEYLDWSRQWMAAVKRVLAPNGAFWLAIGDEYAAELKVIATRELGLFCRSWVVWYYTFGVHCESKFTRSHAHMFHFVRNPSDFVFNAATVRVPSARQLVYADKRANPKGRVPDDTWIIRPVPEPSWILRPQDLPEGMSADSDTWYFPRVCGTFRERMGFHGCQMPEQLLGRIIRASSNKDDLVLDPFAGSGTTLAVAKKLGRKYIGLELSPDYARQAQRRLDSIKIGALLDGAEDSLAVTAVTRTLRSKSLKASVVVRSPTQKVRGLTDIEHEIVGAFESVRRGFSTDRVIADPELNAEFISLLKSKGVPGEPVDWNLALFRVRKANRLKMLGRSKRTELDEAKVEECEFAAEIALRQIRDQHEVTLDKILCAPALVQKFDQFAEEICPGLEPLYYRWAALRIRKYSKKWRETGLKVRPKVRETFSTFAPLSSPKLDEVPNSPGVYALRVLKTTQYIGDTPDLAQWVERARNRYDFSRLSDNASVTFAVQPLNFKRFTVPEVNVSKGAKSVLIARFQPKWNLQDLAVA